MEKTRFSEYKDSTNQREAPRVPAASGRLAEQGSRSVLAHEIGMKREAVSLFIFYPIWLSEPSAAVS
jgi:hypothetical protein